MVKIIDGSMDDVEIVDVLNMVNAYAINPSMDFFKDKSDNKTDVLSEEIKEMKNQCGIRNHIDPYDPKYVASRGRLAFAKRFFKRVIRKTIGWYVKQICDDQVAFNSSLLRLSDSYDASLRKQSALNKKMLNANKGDNMSLSFAFDFEEAHLRGRADTNERLNKYIEILGNRDKVIDCRCRRGEFLELLSQNGKHSYGIDTRTYMIQACQEKGLNVIQEDAIDHLRHVGDESVDGIVALHLVDDIAKGSLFDFMKLAYSRLRHDGIMIIEACNPLCLGIFSNDYYLNPEHDIPVHPVLLRLLAEHNGFVVEPIFYINDFLDECKLDEDVSDPVMRDNIRKLNKVMFGAQDYAMICRKVYAKA